MNALLVKIIIYDGSFWTVKDGNRVVIDLQKKNQMEWWDTVCVRKFMIDVKKVQPENSKLDKLEDDV